MYAPSVVRTDTVAAMVYVTVARSMLRGRRPTQKEGTMSEQKWCHLNGEHKAHEWQSGLGPPTYSCPGYPLEEDYEVYTPDPTAPRTTAEERQHWLTDDGWKGMSLRDLQLLLGDYDALLTEEYAAWSIADSALLAGQPPDLSGQTPAQNEVARLRELLRQSEEEWEAECDRLRGALRNAAVAMEHIAKNLVRQPVSIAMEAGDLDTSALKARAALSGKKQQETDHRQ